MISKLWINVLHCVEVKKYMLFYGHQLVKRLTVCYIRNFVLLELYYENRSVYWNAEEEHINVNSDVKVSLKQAAAPK